MKPTREEEIAAWENIYGRAETVVERIPLDIKGTHWSEAHARLKEAIDVLKAGLVSLESETHARRLDDLEASMERALGRRGMA